MKRRFDRQAVRRDFGVGDKVLILLPIPVNALSAKYSGPYDTNYAVSTPDRRRKMHVCHINMLKQYHTCELALNPVASKSSPPPNHCASTLIITDNSKDGWIPKKDGLKVHQTKGARLPNSEMLKTLPSLLAHLSPQHQKDIA